MIFACADDSDPSQSNLGGTAATAGTGGSAGNAGTGGGEAGSAGSGGGEAGTAGSGGGEAGSAGNGGGEAGTGADPFGICPDEVSFVGQIVGAGADVPDGGNAVFEAWPAEDKTGIAEVIAAVPAEAILDDDSTPDVDEGRQGLVLDTPIQITEATVIATDYKGNFDVSKSRTHFWVGDADGAIELYLNYMDPESIPQFEIQVGQKVSFTVTRVNRYFDKTQIVGIGTVEAEDGTRTADMELASDNGSVYVWEPDRAFTISDIHRVVRVTGTLAGTGDDCGAGYRCWDIDYGSGLAIFRSNSEFLQTGACVTYVGPLSFYNGEPQLNVNNFSWMRIY